MGMVLSEGESKSLFPFNNYSWDFDGLDGRHSGVIAAIVEMEKEDFQGDGNFKPKLAMCVQLEGKGRDGFQRVIPIKFTASLNEKSTLRKALDSAELLKGLMTEGKKNTDWLVGKQLKIKITVETSKKGRKYPKVTQIIDDRNDIQATWKPALVERDEKGPKGGEDIPF